MQGTRPALPMATAWAVMHHLGINGYRQLVRTTIETKRKMVDGIRAIPGLTVLGEPEAQIVAMATAEGWDDRLDVFALGDALQARGWFHDRQTPPDSLHSTVSAGNAPVIDGYLADLSACVEQIAGTRTDDRSTNYATLE
jgi:glutamate/tyrosine decarboxylase-like PLP-dependent enzyme